MTTNTNNTRKSHAIRNGVFAILGVIMLGAALGYAVGFGTPAETNAQSAVIVTANTPAVSTPATSLLSTILSVIAPTAANVVVTANRNNGGDDHGDPCCTDGGDDEDQEVVVTANPGDTGNDDHGAPCCTDTPDISGIDDHGAPCCTTPTTTGGPTPPTTPIPPVLPPPPPPHESRGECVFLAASPGVITQPGQAVTLTWKTRDVDTSTLDNGIGRVANNGSMVVYPTHDTTYILTVTGGTNSINCQAHVKLETTHTDSPRCIDLSIDKTRIERGESATLTWVTENASSVRIDNGVGVVTPTRTGSITIHPREDTTYTATVPNAPFNPDCQVRVSIEDERNRDHDSDDHDRNRDRERPEVFLDSVTRPAEAPLASVYLSEIPYTGLDLGPVGTAVYWTMIVLWSGAAAYLVLFNFLPYLFRRAATDALAASGHLPGWGPTAAGYGLASAMPAAPVPAVHQAAHRAAVATAAPVQRSVAAAPASAAPTQVTGAPVYSPHEGFRSFATGGALTIDDIVKGLSRESGMQLERGAPMIAPVAPAVEAPAMAQTETRTAAYADNIPGFIEALVNGDREHVFGTVRNVTKQGGDAQDFISETVCALDDAYRARTEGADVHPDVARATKDCHTSFLEKIIASLTTALDSTYSAGTTGTKLALTRALAVVNG